MKARHFVWFLRGFTLIFALTISAVFPLKVQAQEHDAPGKQLLHGHVPKAVARLKPVRALPGTTNLQLAVSLPLRNTAALSNLLSEIYNPTSPNYHHYLNTRQFTAQFGPTVHDYQALIKFARANGLRVTAQSPNRLVLDVSGSVANIERAFHTSLRVFQHPYENRLFYAPDTEPSLDLSVPILHIDGLDNYSLPRPRLQTVRPAISNNAQPNSGSGPSGAYMGSDFRTAYVPDTTLTGSGQVVGLLQFDGYTAGDITYYENKAGLPNVPLQNVLIDGASGNPSGSGGEVEVSLDIEMAVSMAPELSKVILYEAPNPSPFVDLLNRMATDDQAKQISCSWYVPNGPAEPAADQIFQQMAAQGQTFLAASGDFDGYTGLIPFPGDTPYITEVGGTTLTTSGPGGPWASETVWNSGGGFGSGGGISTQYSIPTYQTNINMTANQGSTTMRNTPDVALTADGVYVRADGGDLVVTGTSCAAPLWAGFSALINQEALASGHSTIGFLNPLVDAIGTGQNYGAAFHDITTGNNNKFPAVAGYDLCTGWGTPAGQHLIDALANPEALIITPGTGFTALGGVGGPFSVSSENLSLTNSGTNMLTWTLMNTSSWLNTSINGGTLSPGGPATIVTISLNNTASNLPVGNYSATVWFTNLNDNFGQSRQFALNIISPPSITSQPTNQAVLDGATATFSAGVTGGLPLSYHWQFNGTNLSDGGNIGGSTTTTLTISNASTNNTGAYNLVATNYAGVAVSSNALLSLIPSAPVITEQPANQTVGVNASVEFIVAAVGTKPFSYQWSFNTTNLNGATNATLVLTNVQFGQAGLYAVTISNIYGSTLSSNALLTVLPCDPDPAGLVDWWRAEGDATDSIGTNNGSLQGTATFAPGEVGQAFSFDGSSGYVLVPDSPSLDFSNSMTIELWMKSATLNNNGDWQGLVTKGNETWRLMATTFTNTVYVAFNGATPSDLSGTRNVNDGQWHHVAATYDGSSMCLYVDGTLDASHPATGAIAQNTLPVELGGDADPPGGHSYLFNGLLDEVSLYNRALSSNEIAAIYNIGTAGKCSSPTPPVITTEPASQTNFLGATINFSVVASGTRPFTYQWTFETTNIDGATNATLTLTNVQFNQAGAYAVVVANVAGSTNSTSAVLTVNPPPPCVPPPLGLADWWRAEGDATDSVGANNGTLQGTATFAPGEVGQAFSFDGSSGYVLIPDSPSLDAFTTNITIELWMKSGQLAANPDYTGIVAKGNNSWRILGTSGARTITAGLNGVSPNFAMVGTRNVNDGQWHHVALTYDGGTMSLYVDGTLDVSQAGTGAITEDNSSLAIGDDTEAPIGNYFFNGMVDEVSLYNRALSSNEIATIYNAAVSGKCLQPIPPSITVQPTNQTVFAGASPSFTVVAAGALPLYYQWTFDGTNIPGATDVTLSLANVQFSQAGNYAVTITNLYGSTNSLNATLTVNPLPSCDPPPAGIVDWWRAEGDATDSIGTNNGTLQGTASFAPGEVGQAFSFDGSSGYVLVPDSASLDSFSNSMTIELWMNSANLGNNGDWVSLATKGNETWRLMGKTFANTVYVAFDGANPSDLSGTRNVNDGQWHHVAATYDGSRISLYVDGVLDASESATGTLTRNSLPFEIGGDADPPGGHSYLFNGLIDEVSLYNRALSSNEIAAIYQAGVSGKCPGPTPPVITTEPANQTVNAGSNATFTVVAAGSPPLYYQWIFSGTNIAGATNMSLQITNAQPADAGFYSVVVTNLYGSIVSSNALLAVLALPPAITTQPTNQTVNVGSNATFSVIATGTPPLYYQWNFNGTNIVGATNTSLRITNAQPANGGFYSVVVTNLYGSIASSNALLTVLTFPPAITAQPTNQTVNAGATAKFMVAATGTQPLSYQWVFDGTNILSGATNTLLTLTNVQPANAGAYSAVVTNLYGSTTSSNALLTVLVYPPVITNQPQSRTNIVGDTVSFSVTAGGTLPLGYQWTFNTTNIIGATNPTLILTNIQFNQAGNYAVSVTNPFGSTNSTTAVLVVNPPPPCDPPPTGIVNWWRGESNALDTIGTNHGTLVGGVSFVPGEVGRAFSLNGTSSYVSIPDAPSLDKFTNNITVELWMKANNTNANPDWAGLVTKGNSSWRLMATTGARTVSWDLNGPTVLNLSGTRIVNDGQWHHVAATYDGAHMSLYVDGTLDVSTVATGAIAQVSFPVDLGGDANPPPGHTYLFNGSLDEVSLYNRALTSNEIAAIYSAGKTGKCVPTVPFITSQPTNQAVTLGNTGTFTVNAGGTLPLNYQWIFNSNNLAGATNATLTLTNVQFTNAGSYSVLITNAYGSTLSSNAILTVVPNYSFVWNQIPSPRFVNTPFSVTVQAMLTNGVDTNFNGTVALASTNGLPVNPTASGSFNQGIWNGTITITQPASNVVLQATDAFGVSGAANPINIVALPSLSTGISGNTLFVEWPVSPSGFILETATNLNGLWAPAGGSPLPIGGEYLEQVPITGTNTFYRLRFTGP